MEISIDVHGYTVNEAKREIEKLIANCGDNITRVRVIHGFRSGNRLQNLVRSSTGIRSRRINRRRYSMNQGETVLELFEKE
jgi:hypothetical protein